MIALVTDAQTVGKILIACSTPVLAAVWFGRRRPSDPYRDLARESRARAHGRMVRARRLARRQRHCGHPVDERFDVFEPGGRLVYRACCRCGLTLRDVHPLS